MKADVYAARSVVALQPLLKPKPAVPLVALVF